MKFSEMLCKTRNITLTDGTEKGTCAICGKTTNKGLKKQKKLFSGNFTAGNYISNGAVLCPECYYLLKNSNEYRRTMFLLTEDKYIPFKKQEAKEIVLNLPNKPFYIYLTKTWQQIGWIVVNNAYNHDNTGKINIVCDYDIIQTSIETIQEYCDFIRKLRAVKIPKSNLEAGYLEPHQYQRLVDEYGKTTARQMLKKLESLKNNPEWDLSIYLEE